MRFNLIKSPRPNITLVTSSNPIPSLNLYLSTLTTGVDLSVVDEGGALEKISGRLYLGGKAREITTLPMFAHKRK